MGKKIWFVRHSIRSDSIGSEKSPPESDCYITDEGVVLAIKTADLLKEKINKLDKIYSSPYRRTLQTSYSILSIFPKTEMHVLPELSEMITVSCKNHKHAKVPLSLTAYLNAYGVNYPEKSEHVIDRCTRLLKILEDEQFENIILVSHGGIINTLIKMIIPDYKFNNNLAPNVYLPKYCDYVAFEFCEDKEHVKWTFCESSWF